MQLSQENLSRIQPQVKVRVPGPGSFELPERILQFGTGVLLRGLPDYFVNKANRQQLFNGRIVMVKSTDHGDIEGLMRQDNLYTLCIRGLSEGKAIEEYDINNSVSRILQAGKEWEKVLACASDERMQVIISNTTEVGIQLTEDNILAHPPASFPGKLLAFLHTRYQVFKGDKNSGMVIIPTELIVDNGHKLKEILIKLSETNNLSAAFMEWLQQSNVFCNSLVDRIVPGKPAAPEKDKIEERLGYKDDYLIEAEPYRLWAIEVTDERAKELLSFSLADKGVVLTGDISKYRRLKLRLLNGTHTFTCALAFLSGFDTVRAAMEDNNMRAFTEDLMQEISDTIVDDIVAADDAKAFAKNVMERFSNPYIVHKWLSISLQYSSKMKMRNVPLLVGYSEKFGAAPSAMAKGFAAYIRFMRSEKKAGGSFEGDLRGKKYCLQDDRAEVLHDWWKQYPENPVEAILSDISLWGTDLTQLEGFANGVKNNLEALLHAESV